MRLTIDGLDQETPDGLTVEGLLVWLGEPRHELIVEVNHRFVHPGNYQSLGLNPGDRVELIHAAFGG